MRHIYRKVVCFEASGGAEVGEFIAECFKVAAHSFGFVFNDTYVYVNRDMNAESAEREFWRKFNRLPIGHDYRPDIKRLKNATIEKQSNKIK